MKLFEKYTILINGKQAELQEARVSKMPFNRHWPGYQRSLDQTLMSGFVSFDVTGKTVITIACNFDFETAVVRPLSYGITPSRDKNSITFTIDRPCQTVVEFDGMQEALYFFANPAEEKPVLSDTDLYFGPGEHDAGRIVPKNGQTIYIDEGAVVYGEIYAWDAENITIAGRGILDHSKMQPATDVDADIVDPFRPSPILFQYSNNIVIKDIIVRDPCFLAVRPIACEDVVIDNIKIVGCWRYNSDGIDFINARRGHVKNCFVRSFDDSICLKGFHFPFQGEMFHNHKTYDTMEDIIIENCVVWNDWGNALHIGVDLCAKEVKNCVFRNCDVIHSTSSVLNVSNVDYAEIYDILFDDIRVEYEQVTQRPRIQDTDADTFIFDPESTYMPTLFAIAVEKTIYSYCGAKRGKIWDLTFKNISITAPKMPPSHVRGYDDEYGVNGVVFQNVTWNNRPVTNIEEANITRNTYAKNITFIPEVPK